MVVATDVVSYVAPYLAFVGAFVLYMLVGFVLDYLRGMWLRRRPQSSDGFATLVILLWPVMVVLAVLALPLAVLTKWLRGRDPG